jgi:Protein of unknown function (DUF3726)
MSVSLNEVESLAYKAAWGAGLSWGLAEDAAAAARWLAAHRLDWARALADVLEQASALSAPAGHAASEITGRTPGAVLCPIRTGTWLSDQGAGAPDRQMTIRRVVSPILLVPFVARLGSSARFWFEAAIVDCRAGSFNSTGSIATAAQDVIVHIAGGSAMGTATSRPAATDPLTIDAASYARLSALEARTYVPASDTSRLSGAGAGLADND